MIVNVSTKPETTITVAGRVRVGRIVTCRYLRGRGNQATRCTAEPATDADVDDLKLCARHLGLAVAAFKRLTAGIEALPTTEETPS